MATVDHFIRFAAAEAPMIPEAVIERYAIRGLRMFCRDSTAWREELPFSLSPRTATYDLSRVLPPNTNISEILSVNNGEEGINLDPVTHSQLSIKDPKWRKKTAANPSFYLHDPVKPNEVMLSPNPVVASSPTFVTVQDVIYTDDHLIYETTSAHGLEEGDSVYAVGQMSPLEAKNNPRFNVMEVISTTRIRTDIINERQNFEEYYNSSYAAFQNDASGAQGVTRTADGIEIIIKDGFTENRSEYAEFRDPETGISPPAVGDYVHISNVKNVGLDEIIGKEYRIDEIMATSDLTDSSLVRLKILDGTDTTGYAAWGGAGGVYRVYRRFAVYKPTYVAYASILPDYDATYIADSLTNRYEEVITSAILSLIYKIPDMPWTDIALASGYMAAYESGVALARSKAEAENMKLTTRKVKYGGY